MNIRDLEYLIAVDDYKHFGKASEKCFVSQPALSMQLQKLEDNLGIKLFERSNKKIITTQAGKDIIFRARNIVRDIYQMKEVAKLYQDPFAGELRLGAFSTLASYLLPKVVPEISLEYKNLKLLLLDEKSKELIEKLKIGNIDIALLSLPVNEDFLQYKKLFDEESFLAVSKSHKFAKKKFIEHKDLKGEKFLLLDDGHCLGEQILSLCAKVGAIASNNFRATSLETLRQMVISNAGVTLIPKIAIDNNENIIYLPFKDNPPIRTIVMAWRKTSAKIQYFNELIELFINAN